ncbi:hypothetical protein D187_001711 [Cystobacter fuscus DSM 2262]|uniref:Uncharacterized protein n=2 Tax=Cystobacter fuscus TaxID=43 RepID=S9QIG6_CYSF2|nr:hypothetical protein D187_001711 [Cystobacter fuscus DSM 2262]
MRRYGTDLWVVSMREYNEDPVFSALVGPTTFAARRRTIYVFSPKQVRRGRARHLRQRSARSRRRRGHREWTRRNC